MNDDPWRARYWGADEPPDTRNELRAMFFVLGWVLIAIVLIAWAVVAWNGVIT